ncbi:MAG TPA: hypothetical protein VFE50_16205 [Cyclobacteriaceae bacterium]|nr:hypothetical protein [Cyclobacteriaceae bacterium]
MEQVIPNDDELKASNEVLKLKLELEHGMQSYKCDGLSPQLENQWLNYIYTHEQMHRECGRVSVYEYVGRPAFIAVENLERDQVTAELERLLTIMRQHGVQLDCVCRYDDVLIYTFLTKELFIEEMDNIHMPGLVNHFTYEDFHMNHQYEIERIGVEFIKSIYQHEWRAEYDSIWLADNVMCNGVDYDFEQFTSLITGFQQRNSFLEIRELNISEISVDEKNGDGQLNASLTYMQQEQQRKGNCSIVYKRDVESGYWNIVSVEAPGVN